MCTRLWVLASVDVLRVPILWQYACHDLCFRQVVLGIKVNWGVNVEVGYVALFVVYPLFYKICHVTNVTIRWRESSGSSLGG